MKWNYEKEREEKKKEKKSCSQEYDGENFEFNMKSKKRTKLNNSFEVSEFFYILSRLHLTPLIPA